jgi:hypothetical protein
MAREERAFAHPTSDRYPDETLVQHWLAVQAGLSQSGNINTVTLCWAPDIPMRSLCFPRRVPNRKGHQNSAV